MLTPCPCCGKITNLTTEDAYSPVERDRLCPRCFWAKEILAKAATMEEANHCLVAHEYKPLTEDDIRQVARV